MTAPFPHTYSVRVQSPTLDAALGRFEGATGPSATVGPPPQFGGAPGHLSPEDLLLGAVASCHMTTLGALLARRPIPISDYVATVEGTLEKTREGLRFVEVRLNVSARTEPGRETELIRTLELAEKHCIVSNALNVTVAFEAHVTS